MSGEPFQDLSAEKHNDLKEDEEEEDYDETYFSSYSDINVHKLMLQDRPRTEAYKSFIEKNKHLIEGKIVLDVGAGTGILSMFAAKAGAKHVYAVEGSPISHACAGIIGHNGFSEQITVIHGRVEDISLPDGVKADVLISEWMGFYLLHESMLNSVIVARDRFLDQDGLILPSTCSLYLCPVNMKEFHDETYGWCQNVYGFDLSPLIPAVEVATKAQPQILMLKSEQCLAKPELVCHLDLMYVASDDIRRIIGSFNFEMNKNGVMHGFACWFNVIFGEEDDKTRVVLSTAPDAPETHWKQTAILLPRSLMVCKGEVVSCNIELVQDEKNPRHYNITVDVDDDDDDDDDDDVSGSVAPEVETDVRGLIMKAMTSTD